MGYMTEKEARSVLTDLGRRSYERAYVAANDGNISCRISADTILITPSGVSKGYMTDDMMVKVSLDGRVLTEGKPSSEMKMHLRIYRGDSWCYASPSSVCDRVFGGRDSLKPGNSNGSRDGSGGGPGCTVRPSGNGRSTGIHRPVYS